MAESIDTATMNLWQKLAKVRSIADVIAKNKSGYGYRYVSEDEVLAKVKAGLDKYNLFIYPIPDMSSFSIVRRDFIKKKFDKATQSYIDDPQSEYCVRGWLNFRVVNTDNPDDAIVVPWPLVGSQADDSQAVGSSFTYSNRYFMMKFFGIATPEDDPDEWKRKKSEAADAEEAAAVTLLVGQLDTLIRANLTEENKAEITALIKKNLKIDGKPSSNYLKIKSLEDAQNIYTVVSNYLDKQQK